MIIFLSSMRFFQNSQCLIQQLYQINRKYNFKQLVYNFVVASHCFDFNVKPCLQKRLYTHDVFRLFTTHIFFSRTSRRCLRQLQKTLNYLLLLQPIPLLYFPHSSIAEHQSACISSYQSSYQLWFRSLNILRHRRESRHLRSIASSYTHSC